MNDTEILDNEARKSAAALQAKGHTADEATLQILFTESRTHYGWQEKDVSEDTLRALYDIAKMGPHIDEPAANAHPVHSIRGGQGPA